MGRFIIKGDKVKILGSWGVCHPRPLQPDELAKVLRELSLRFTPIFWEPKIGDKFDAKPGVNCYPIECWNFCKAITLELQQWQILFHLNLEWVHQRSKTKLLKKCCNQFSNILLMNQTHIVACKKSTLLVIKRLVKRRWRNLV